MTVCNWWSNEFDCAIIVYVIKNNIDYLCKFIYTSSLMYLIKVWNDKFIWKKLDIKNQQEAIFEILSSLFVFLIYL